MNNNHNRLKQWGNFYFYNHFNLDGHFLDDSSIMLTEDFPRSPGGTTTIGSKFFSREDFWYKNLVHYILNELWSK